MTPGGSPTARGPLASTSRTSQWPDMVHVWHCFGSFLPEAQQAIQRIGDFTRQRTG